MRLRIALVVIACSATSVFAAEAVAYKGTIGRIAVILEMAEGTGSGNFAARYAYLSRGVDIPLRGKTDISGHLVIEEEAPCDEKTCKNAEGTVLEKPPIGADWTLASAKEGRQLKGTWKDRKTGKSLPISLDRVGSRPLGDGSGESIDDLDPSSATVSSMDMRIGPKDLPYDFLKLEHPVKQGPEAIFGDAVIRFDTDSRTDTAYPTIVKLAGADPTAINIYLKQQWLQFQFNAYHCKSKIYLGNGWFGNESEGGTGYEDGGSAVTIEHLTPRLLGYAEHGSYYCGGAYPDHFENRHFADVETGKPVVAESLIKGFVLKNSSGEEVNPASVTKDDYVQYGPNAELATFVNDRRDKSDASRESDCGMADLVASNLGVHFTQTELVFNLKGLPHVTFACTDDLVKIPLRDARPLLTDEGMRLLFGK